MQKVIEVYVQQVVYHTFCAIDVVCIIALTDDPSAYHHFTNSGKSALTLQLT
jgi:hypothetical protein